MVQAPAVRWSLARGGLSRRLLRFDLVYASRRFLVTVLAMTMGFAFFGNTVFGVLASEIISSMGIDRWQVGMLATAATVGGALLSPRLGKWVDMVGGRRSTITTLMVAGVALLSVGVAPEFSLLVGAAVLTGIALAIANPATNKLICREFEPGRRGLIVGVKQAGAQIGIFFGGWLLPVFAGWWGWRWAVLAFAVIPMVTGVSYMRKRSPGAGLSTPDQDEAAMKEAAEVSLGQVDLPTRRRIHRITVYAFLVGVGTAAVIYYLPLYAEEELGMGSGQAGQTLAFSGLLGIVGRIGWARVAERRLGTMRGTMIIAVLAIIASLTLAFGSLLGTWSVWLAAGLMGLSISSWHSVGMLAVIQILPSSLAGRGSGLVYFGFLTGLGGGAPLFGWSVDRLGVYTTGWLAIAALFLFGFWLICGVREKGRLPQVTLG